MTSIYLDHNATTPIHPRVLGAMLPFLEARWGNPSSPYRFGVEARIAVEEARMRIADCLACRPTEVVFCSSGTEADNLALRGVARALGSKGRHIVTSSIEHHAVIATCRALEREGVRVTYLPVSPEGVVELEALAASPGIDLVPFKTCSYDCIYCQLGRTTNRTTELREYVPVCEVLDELAEKLGIGPEPDFIGLAGSGEPTLHSRIGDLVAGVKRLTKIPVAVLTNGSMLWRPEVRAGLEEADLVLPSLDAGSASSFERVNRPHRDLSYDGMVEGLLSFARGFEGRIWLEGFPYRVSIWTLVPACLGAGVLTLLVAWATVGGNAASVARANPIAALRYE